MKSTEAAKTEKMASALNFDDDWARESRNTVPPMSPKLRARSLKNKLPGGGSLNGGIDSKALERLSQFTGCRSILIAGHDGGGESRPAT